MKMIKNITVSILSIKFPNDQVNKLIMWWNEALLIIIYVSDVCV